MSEPHSSFDFVCCSSQRKHSFGRSLQCSSQLCEGELLNISPLRFYLRCVSVTVEVGMDLEHTSLKWQLLGQYLSSWALPFYPQVVFSPFPRCLDLCSQKPWADSRSSMDICWSGLCQGLSECMGLLKLLQGKGEVGLDQTFPALCVGKHKPWIPSLIPSYSSPSKSHWEKFCLRQCVGIQDSNVH